MNDTRRINSLHREAMDLAAKAFQADVEGRLADAQRLFEAAFQLERRAAMHLVDEHDAEPTRSVLFRSAASLAVDCRQFREAERLIACALIGEPPAEIADELRDVLERVYFSRHLDLKGLELDPIEFQMSLVGSSVGFGVVESKQFLRRADTLDKLLVRTAERKQQLPFRENGGPSKAVTERFQVYFSAARAASYAITVRLGRPQRQLLMDFANPIAPSEVIDDVLEGLTLFSESRVEEVRDRIRDDAYFNNFASLAKNLAPDGTQIRSVGFTAVRGDEKQFVALRSPPTSVWSPQTQPSETSVYLGWIRAADETAKRQRRPYFCVEDSLGEVSPQIRVPPGVLQDIVKPYWGEFVRVTVRRRRKGSPEMVEIEPASEDEGF